MTSDTPETDAVYWKEAAETGETIQLVMADFARALAALRGAAGNAAYICRSGFGRHYACWCCTIQRGAHRGEMT